MITLPDPANHVTSVRVRHNFETAHRLPFLGGKCTNLHGHSWWAEITVSGHPDHDGLLVDFGALKTAVRAWIDTHLDHGAMLGKDDPLLPALREDGTRLFVFGHDDLAEDLHWPTVEHVALLLARVATRLLARNGWGDRCRVTEVTVQETHVNQAAVTP
jgi:6-pyruvoyltetrahydropterin/6-carboxytetrahydropterin synthase